MVGRKSATSSRETILDAAVRVALRDGILAMTLDAVAKEAGVSKGGLIYHFQSKDDLIAAMLEHFRARSQLALEEAMAGDENPKGRSFRTFVRTVFPPAPGAAPSEMDRFLTAMLAASANNPRLLDPIRGHMVALRRRLLAEGPNGLRQFALWPAVYGLLLWQHLGVITEDDPILKAMLDELLTLAKGPADSARGE